MTEIKDEVIAAIRNLPDAATYDDIMDVVYAQQKIAKGLQQAREGKVLSDDEFEQRAVERRAKWVKHRESG